MRGKDVTLQNVSVKFGEFTAVHPTDLEINASEFFSILEDENVDLTNPATLADPSVQDALQRAGEKMEATEFDEAADNVSEWFDQECEGLGG